MVVKFIGRLKMMQGMIIIAGSQHQGAQFGALYLSSPRPLQSGSCKRQGKSWQIKTSQESTPAQVPT